MMSILQVASGFDPGPAKFNREETMGRTVMPFSHVLEEEKGRWKEFRKRLAREDQEAFDRLFARGKFHTAAGVYKAHPYPLETILLSVILEHEKMIREIADTLKEESG